MDKSWSGRWEKTSFKIRPKDIEVVIDSRFNVMPEVIAPCTCHKYLSRLWA